MTKHNLPASDPLAGLRLLSFKRVRELTTFSGQQIRVMAKQGRFPKPIQISDYRVAFLEVEVVDWLRQQQSQRATPAAWQPEAHNEAAATA
jgi:predicted DNA-binding transcriptional regulator AlpA